MSSTTSSAPAKKRVAKKTEDVVAPVVAAPVVAAVAPAVVETKKSTKKVAATAAAPAVVPSPAPVAPVASTESTTTAAAVEAPATSLDEDMKSVLTRLSTLRETVSTMITEVKKLEKRVHREIKDARKRRRRVPKEGEEVVKRGPSIFEIPTKVSDELCKFLGKPNGTLISRSNVTKEVNNYLKANNLKNKHNINPDPALRKLLDPIPAGEQLSYFNLQRYLNKHYIKEAKPVPVA